MACVALFIHMGIHFNLADLYNKIQDHQDMTKIVNRTLIEELIVPKTISFVSPKLRETPQAPRGLGSHHRPRAADGREQSALQVLGLRGAPRTTHLGVAGHPPVAVVRTRSENMDILGIS